MRTYILIFAIFIFGCDSNQKSKEKVVVAANNECFQYPSAIDSLKMSQFYDSARWCVYTWHCNEYFRPKSDTSLSISFGELPLKFESLDLKHDTIEINFNFIYKGRSILPSLSRDNKELVTGVGLV